MNIKENTMVFVYSGYRYLWQNVDKIVEKFKYIDSLLEEAHFMFLCDSDLDFEKKIRTSFPKGNYTIKLLPKKLYFDYLCACDVGFLIRDYNETNRVAFPNKFSDYLCSGLLVAINNALPEPVRLLKKYDIPFIDVDSFNEDAIINVIELRKSNYDDFIEKCIFVCENELKYDSQIANNCQKI